MGASAFPYENQRLTFTEEANDPEDAYREIWQAVIGRAWLDAFPPNGVRKKNREAAQLAVDSRLWLVADGHWGAARRFVCMLAEADERILRLRAWQHMRQIGEDVRTPLLDYQSACTNDPDYPVI